MPQSWREVFFTLRPDIPLEILRQRALDAEVAIRKRLKELAASPNHTEHSEIDAALRTIHQIQVEKLNYPHFLQEQDEKQASFGPQHSVSSKTNSTIVQTL
jgi:ribonuclease BN (tRNA processing enzyme)